MEGFLAVKPPVIMMARRFIGGLGRPMGSQAVSYLRFPHARSNPLVLRCYMVVAGEPDVDRMTLATTTNRPSDPFTTYRYATVDHC